MGTKNPVQLSKECVATVFGWDVAPPMLEVKPKAQELAEVVGKIRHDTFALQQRVLDRVRVIETHAGILAPVELPLRENACPVRTLSIAAGARRDHRVREHDFAAQQIRLPLTLPKR